MEFSVCFLFAHGGDKLLLIQKDRSEYKGRLNGVGGKLEYNSTTGEKENIYACAAREIKEETGVVVSPDKNGLLYLGTTVLPIDEQAITLHFFAAEVHQEDARQMESERLVWVKTSEVLNKTVRDRDLAGDGDIQYWVYRACRAFGWYY